ncbi:8380_t:CDS:10 [Funneliformis geosporum]|uniref:Protein transport protein SEC31 n=1 Tax=Funneliformis geosporum TaxID=1117311 RepID=A0A9W4SVJ9_9GLOM|nr:8380_t:CDS:10 [Funneliformis geosporum]
MKLKEIPRTATFAWSPGQHLPIIATGTVAGALDASFSSTTELELFHLNLNKSDSGVELHSAGVINSNARFDRLVWGVANDKAYGIVAAGLENGELDLYDPAIILEGGDSEEALILRNTTHSGNVRGLQFNPFQINLLASAATNAEIYIWDLTKPDKPYTPGTRSPKLEDITHLAWNNQVQHILATSSNTGSTVIWDLRSKKHVMDLSFGGSVAAGNYGMGNNMAPGMGTGVRRGTTAVAWSPDNATQIITASEDDMNPVIVIWDVRNAHAPEKILTGHQKGVLSLSWCQRDADLLLSCGKDNRVLCWNPRTAEIIGELPASSNWVFDVQWCPGNPDLFASASFDGKISVHSLQSGQSRDGQQVLLDNNDPFAQIASSYEPSLTLKQPPKWLKRPVGVTFGFGGKLVSFNNKVAIGAATQIRRIVTISTVFTEPEIIQRSNELESSIESKSLDRFCESRSKSAPNELESENWKILHTMFNENENAREQLVKHLGFLKSDIVTQISTAITNMNINGSVNFETQSSVSEAVNEVHGIADQSVVKSENIEELFSGPSTSADASEFFNSEIISDSFPVHSPTSTYKEQTSSSSINKGIFKIYPAQESDVDKLITRSIVLGDFESAVNLCLESDRLSDAVLLAGCGGPELLQRTRKIYFERKASNIPYLRLLQSIVSEDLSDIVYNADLSEWQEIVVVLCTFARSEDFGGLCNALGQRLEQESGADSNDKSKGAEFRKNAVLCYLAAGNLENVVKIWISEQEEEEQAELKDANQDDTKSSSSRYSFHAKTLQSLIEKVTVFRKAIDYVDSDLVQNLDDNTTESNNRMFKLAKLYDKYAEYVEILVAQGRLATALKYLNLTPLEYKKAGVNDVDPLAAIRERLYHSGVDVSSIKVPPAFPFEQFYVGAEGEADHALAATEQPQKLPYNQYAYNAPIQNQTGYPYPQPAFPVHEHANFAATEQPQKLQYNQYAYNAPIQNQPVYPYPQPAFPVYEHANLIPPPPPPIANTNLQNTNPSPQADVPAVYNKNLSNWNDPPTVSSAQAAKKTIQAQANKPLPIITPFPSAISPAPQGTIPPPGVHGPNQNIQGATNLQPPPPPYYGADRSTPTPPQVGGYGDHQTPVAQPARTPTPAKTPTPVNKHPAGDRTHIPVTHKPIYDVLSRELQRTKQYYNAGIQARQLIDIEKRLNVLFDQLNNEEISNQIIADILKLVQERRDYVTAQNTLIHIMTSHSSESRWLVGIKQLLSLSKNVQ